jgi:septal ring factor EnvC (AmiA/AmiB activator)
MKISQSNYLNMSNAVLALFDSNVKVWTGIPIVVNGLGRLRGTLADIVAAATKQGENNPVGHTLAKERSRDGLEGAVYTIALRVRSFAGITGDDVLAEQMRFSRSSLDLLRTNDLLTRGRMVLDICAANLPALSEYQVDQQTIDDLQHRIDQTAQLYAHRDTVIDQRMEATAHLQGLIPQARKQLKVLDDLVEAYIDDDTFVATYFNARRIHDLRGRKAKPEVKD